MPTSSQKQGTSAADYNTLLFIIEQRLMKIVTCALVKVLAVSNSGGVSPVGTVDVQPLVNQLTADGTALPHGTIYRLPYMRMQGGASAVIMDPEVGDIGMCGFSYRDISVAKGTKDFANPGSARTYDWADGLYFGGFLNGAPTQYVRFLPSAGGVEVVSPVSIKLQAPTVDIEASTGMTLNSPAVTIEGGGTKIDGKVFLTHVHTGVQTGGSDTGPVGP